MAEPDASDTIPEKASGEATDLKTRAAALGVFNPGAGLVSPARFGVFVRGGLVILGLLAGALVLVDPINTGGSSQPALAVRWLRAGWLVLAFSLAGWAFDHIVRILQALMAELLERDSRRSRQLENSLDQTARLLNRIATNLEERGQPVVGERQETGQGAMQDRLAALNAAREVNDPVRVLVLFEEIAPLLEDERRATLRSDVAQWFLSAIYRRLRAGRIQVEVVELATRFAASFAATTEGASVQAALPTLRRSAGLCPLCAQPYTGVAKACPECLRHAVLTGDGFSPSIEPIPPE